MILGKFKKYVENAEELLNEPKSNKKGLNYEMNILIKLYKRDHGLENGCHNRTERPFNSY